MVYQILPLYYYKTTTDDKNGGNSGRQRERERERERENKKKLRNYFIRRFTNDVCIFSLISDSYFTYLPSTFGTGGKLTSILVLPEFIALDTADAACFDTCSLNQPSYNFGIPFPPSINGTKDVTNVAGAVARRIARRNFILTF